MPVWIRLLLGVVLVLVTLTIIALAVLGARGRLHRNRYAGIRTGATMKTEKAFEIAHRAAAVPLGVAGVVALVGGVVLLTGPEGPLAWVVFGVAIVGFAVLTGVAGLVGDRAAVHAVNHGLADDPEPEPVAACAGSCVGCDLVEGCRAAIESGSSSSSS